MKKLKYLSLVLVFLLLVMTGCTSKEQNENGTGKLEQVDLVLDWYPNAVHSFIYAAIEKGYFKEEGLNVNIQFPSNSTDPLTLPAAGKATVGVYYQPDVILSRTNQDVPVKSIGSIVQAPLNVIIALKEKGINSPKDLSGKTIGHSGNPLNIEYVKTMVEKDGGNPETVKIIDVGFELLSAMITKKVDATTGGLINHEVPVMKHDGYEINYFDPSKYGVPNYNELLFVTSDKTLNEKPETLRKFLRACEKGFKFMKENPEEALKILLQNQQKDSFPLIEEVEKESMKTLLPKMELKDSPFLSQDDKVWEDNINWMYEKGMIEKKLNAKDFYVDLLSK